MDLEGWRKPPSLSFHSDVASPASSLLATSKRFLEKGPILSLKRAVAGVGGDSGLRVIFPLYIVRLFRRLSGWAFDPFPSQIRPGSTFRPKATPYTRDDARHQESQNESNMIPSLEEFLSSGQRLQPIRVT